MAYLLTLGSVLLVIASMPLSLIFVVKVVQVNINNLSVGINNTLQKNIIRFHPSLVRCKTKGFAKFAQSEQDHPPQCLLARRNRTSGNVLHIKNTKHCRCNEYCTTIIFQEYERAVIFRLGRLLTGGARGPGVFFIIPCVDVYEKVDMRTQTFEIPPQEVCFHLLFYSLKWKIHIV